MTEKDFENVQRKTINELKKKKKKRVISYYFIILATATEKFI